MKRISNWSLVGYIMGIVFSAGSFIRYYILYSDLDKSIAYILLGLIICGLSWLYNQNLQVKNKLLAIEDYLTDKK